MAENKLSRVNYSLTQLEYVLALHQQGHFAKAAQVCHVTQPTLSMQIQKLENDLEVVIFDRSKKPILLTQIGQKIIPQIQNILTEARKLEGMIEMNQGQAVAGELTIGIIPTIAPYIVPRLLPILQKQYPEIKLKIQELQTQQILNYLDRDSLDVGLLALPLKIPRLFEIGLYYEPFYLMCQKSHAYAQKSKVNLVDLSFSDIWLLEEGHCLRNQIVDLCDLNLVKNDKRSFLFESGSLETLKRLIQSFGGYTLLPELACDQISPQALVLPFKRPIPAREVGLVYRREHYKETMIEILGQLIIECLPEAVRKLRSKDLEVLPV